MKQWILNFEIQAAQKSDLWEKGNEWREPHNCPSFLPGENFQATSQGEESQAEEVVSMSWGDRARAGIHRAEYQRGDSCTKESVRDLQRLTSLL